MINDENLSWTVQRPHAESGQNVIFLFLLICDILRRWLLKGCELVEQMGMDKYTDPLFEPSTSEISGYQARETGRVIMGGLP